jgi:hypothetical protein
MAKKKVSSKKAAPTRTLGSYLLAVGLIIASGLGGAVLESGTKVLQNNIQPYLEDASCYFRDYWRMIVQRATLRCFW